MPAYVCRQRAFHAGRIVEPGDIVAADSCPGPWAEGMKEPKAPAKGSGDRKRESKSPEKGSETAVGGQQAGPVDPESIV